MDFSSSETLPAGDSRQIVVRDAVLNLMWCPPGSFRMGTPAHQQVADSWDPEHEVILSHGFWIGRSPVTPGLWRAVMNDVPLREQHDDESPLSVSWRQAIALTDALTRLLRESRTMPAASAVSLPTEAQWEYACRAGTATRWYFGEDERRLVDHAWYRANSDDHIHPVEQKQPNPWGLFDVYGNIPEWCLDDFTILSGRLEEDPCHIVETQDTEGNLKITRGGGYENGADSCRSASRIPSNGDNPYFDDIGFRLVVGPAPKSQKPGETPRW